MSASFIVQPPAGDGFKIVLTTAGTFEISGQVVSNEAGADVDHRFEGDTATNLVVIDGGLDAFQIGTTVAGAIADFRATSIVFNENSADMDLRVESNGNANMLFVDGGADRVGIGTGTPEYQLDVFGTSYPTIRADSSGVNGGQLELRSSAGKWDVYLQGSDLRFFDGSTDKITLQNGGAVIIGGTSPQSGYELTVNNDIYAVGDVSALTFTDRTDYPESLTQAYRAIKSLSGKGGKLDHDKLDPFVKAQDGRNLSALVSAQAEVIKDLIERIDALEAA